MDVSQLVKPVDLTQVLLAIVTVAGGLLGAWLQGKKAARIEAGAARVEAGAARAEEHEKRAAEHAEIAVQASMRPAGIPSTLQGIMGDVKIESLPPEVLESVPPSAQAWPRPSVPVDRPTPRDRGTVKKE